MQATRITNNLMKIYVTLFILTTSAILFLSCAHKVDVPLTPTVSFSKDVLPVFIGNCDQPGCHSGNRRKPLDNYSYIMSYGQVTPYNAVGSKIYKVMSARGIFTSRMPPSGVMNEGDLQNIYIWIQQGAKNN